MVNSNGPSAKNDNNMFRNQLTSSLRNLAKNKVFSIINILGLAVGLGAFLLIWQFVRFERSYDPVS